ncbi:flagellar basal body-associated protein FliL [Actimicrobium sp. GrIS 1.19]|uniref:flagellar basal body-associated FliL family protein n=1 Tax=Actimicrobium sp. GrIS 1.19 TaxID=3071708 RepID=UPI002E03C9BC|nr:flagellar basal body-associated protein FliL [Actimicrobium sp. GrIS 1.19]
MKKPAKAANNDMFVIVTIAVILTALLGIFGATWYFRSYVPEQKTLQAFTLIEPLVISTDTYSLAAKIAIQTNRSNQQWATENKPAILTTIKGILDGLEPAGVHAPGGLATLQTVLKDAVNKRFKTTNVEQVLFMDFLLQTGV